MGAATAHDMKAPDRDTPHGPGPDRAEPQARARAGSRAARQQTYDDGLGRCLGRTNPTPPTPPISTIQCNHPPPDSRLPITIPPTRPGSTGYRAESGVGSPCPLGAGRDRPHKPTIESLTRASTQSCVERGQSNRPSLRRSVVRAGPGVSANTRNNSTE